MIEKVKQWLEGQGFSLEMRTASAFRKARFEVRQSTYYIDPETRKPREIDVLASLYDLTGIVRVHFVVECKSSQKPWVLLSSRDTLTGYNRIHAFGALNQTARSLLMKHFQELVHDRLPWLEKPDLVAYSFRQAFSEVDVAYTASIGVVKACESLVRATSRYDTFAFAFPVIVTDSPLVQCVLGENGEIQVQQVSKGEFLFSGHDLGTCIRVLNIDALDDYVGEAQKVAPRLLRQFGAEAERVLAELKREAEYPR
jgi:hypothetical protein